MENELDIIDKAILTLYYKNTFIIKDRQFNVVLLIREKDWRPLSASWWKKKEACIIGVDYNGNFYLRVCDGTVRFWDHQSQKDEIIAQSVKEFITYLT
ncbi:MAG: hypothetical protein WDA22_17225 [Bacteroidota bacterium]